MSLSQFSMVSEDAKKLVEEDSCDSWKSGHGCDELMVAVDDLSDLF